MSNSSPKIPTAEGDYKAPQGMLLDPATWDAVFKSVADRLKALEAKRTELQEVIDLLTSQALGVISESVSAEIEAQRDRLAGLDAQFQVISDAYQELADGGFFADGVRIQGSLSGLSGDTVQVVLQSIAEALVARQVVSEKGVANGYAPLGTDAKVAPSFMKAMSGATALAAGTAGIVPPPPAGAHNFFLRGDGAYADIPRAAPSTWASHTEVTTPGSGSFTVPAGVYFLRISVNGPGGNGGLAYAYAQTFGGNGGAGGGFARKVIPVSPGQVIPYTVGSAGAAPSTTQHQESTTGGPNTPGASGVGPSSCSGMVANPGQGARGIWYGSYPSAAALGGTATGGDTNIQGGNGGVTTLNGSGNLRGSAGGGTSLSGETATAGDNAAGGSTATVGGTSNGQAGGAGTSTQTVTTQALMGGGGGGAGYHNTNGTGSTPGRGGHGRVLFEIEGPAPTTPAYSQPTTQGGIGTYMLGYRGSGATTAFGDTAAGSLLIPTSAIGVSNQSAQTAQTGTWRCMGWSMGGGGANNATLWLRIA